MHNAWLLRSALVGWLVSAAVSGCDADDGGYAASVADIQHDVRAYVTIDRDAKIAVSFRRVFGSEAYQLEHCPVLHARGTVNGRTMTLTRPGGWTGYSSSGGGLLSGSGGFCDLITYELVQPGADVLDAELARFEFVDEGGAIHIDIPFIGAELGLALPDPALLVPGQAAEVEVTPSVRVLPVPQCSLHYLGSLAEKSPGNAAAGFSVDDLEATQTGLRFMVPSAGDSHGELELRCTHDIRELDLPDWPWVVERCEGVGDCVAQRVNPKVHALELSVTASGHSVEPDPRSDPAGWSVCWLSGSAHGAREFSWRDSASCSSGTRPQERMKFTWPGTSFVPNLTLTAEAYAPVVGTSYEAQVTVTDGEHSAWTHEHCTVSIDKVWPAEKHYDGIIDGHCECDGPAHGASADADLTLDRFEFRGPQLKPQESAPGSDRGM